MSTSCSCLDGNCNHCWNEQTLYNLGLHHVWKVNGHWIPMHERYPEGWTQQLGWYTYCDTFNIHWPYPRLLPEWAITNVDHQHQYEWSMDTNMIMDLDENDRKCTYTTSSCCMLPMCYPCPHVHSPSATIHITIRQVPHYHYTNATKGQDNRKRKDKKREKRKDYTGNTSHSHEHNHAGLTSVFHNIHTLW